MEELNYAAAWNAAQKPPVFTDAELVRMVTLYPAELGRLDDKIGILRRHHFADLLVVRSRESDAYRALINASPADVRLIIIGGSPVYGDEDLIRALEPEAQLDPVQFCGTMKFLNLESEKMLQAKAPKPWKDTVANLTRALKSSGVTLSELAPCVETSNRQ